jgi:hypothetical protein
MMQKRMIFAATGAALAVASVAISPSDADARVHHYVYRTYESYAFPPSYGIGYRFGTPYHFIDRLGSNLNPDRQMVGQGE